MNWEGLGSKQKGGVADLRDGVWGGDQRHLMGIIRDPGLLRAGHPNPESLAQKKEKSQRSHSSSHPL